MDPTEFDNPLEEKVYRLLKAQRCFISVLQLLPVLFQSQNDLDRYRQAITEILITNQQMADTFDLPIETIPEIINEASKYAKETAELEKIYGLDDPRPIPREGI